MSSGSEGRGPSAGDCLDFRILGVPEVWLAETRLPVTAIKQLAVLTMGLLSANRVVATDQLIDGVWGDEPPRTAPALIQTYVSALRRVLGDDGTIVTRPPGYLVRISPSQLDLHRFEALASAGRDATGAGDQERAAATFAEALQIWRGPPLHGLTSDRLANEARRLDESRMVVLEERIAADLRCGRAATLVPELAALVTEYPLRERLRGYAMLALYHLGRQAEALDSFRATQRTLRAELGIEPGPELQELHRAMLRADPALDPPRPRRVIATPAGTAPGGPVSAPRVIPGQLPPAVVELIGRDSELATLAATLSAASGAHQPAYVEITGRAGSGKTALAVAAAHRVRAEFPDGQFYAVLQDGSLDGTAKTFEVLGAFLRVLGVDPAQLPATLGERSGLYRSILAGRRVLVLLDDALSEEQVRPLVLTSPGTATLITSRRTLAGLEETARLQLDVLVAEAAQALLGRLVGPARIAAEPEAASEIVELCDRLPLAVRTAGARLAGRQRWPLAVLASRLRDERRRLDELFAGDLAVRTSLELTYSGLADPLRLAFRRLGALGASEFGPWILAGLLGVPAAKAEYLAERLTDAQLLDAFGVDASGELRYRIHDLVRLYARERAEIEDPSVEQAAAIRALVGKLIDVLGGPDSAAGADPVPDLEADRSALVVLVERTSELGDVELACDLSEALLSSFRLRNRFDEWWRTHDAALRAARTTGSRRSEARLIVGLGQLRYEQDRLVEAADLYSRALSMFDGAGDDHYRADALIGLGAALREHGELDRALVALRQAAQLIAGQGDPARRCWCAYGIGYVLREQGDFAGSHAALADALTAARGCADQRPTGLTLRSIALTYRAAGQLAEAADFAAQALAVLDSSGDELLTAYARQTLAKTHLRQGYHRQALDPLNDALATCRRFGDEFGTVLVLRTLGELYLARDELEQAKELLGQARDRFAALDFPLFRARAERDLAAAYERAGDAATAERIRDHAHDTFVACGSRERDELPTPAVTGAAVMQDG